MAYIDLDSKEYREEMEKHFLNDGKLQYQHLIEYKDDRWSEWLDIKDHELNAPWPFLIWHKQYRFRKA